MRKGKSRARIAAVGGSLGALVAATAGVSGPASADDWPVVQARDVVLKPSDTWQTNAVSSLPTVNGTMVYAFSTAPLTGPAGANAGLPEGVSVTGQYPCKPAPEMTAVYLCKVGGNGTHSAPLLSFAPQIADNTTGYYGAAYAPAGSSLDAAIETARTAAATPADSSHGSGTFTIKTPAHVAQNTMAFTAPDIRAGSAASHTVHVHALDHGNLYVYFTQAPGQIDWGGHTVGIRLSDLAATNDAHCTYGDQSGTPNLGVIRCDVAPGDTDITYTVTVAAGTESWKLQTTALYQVYTYGSDYQRAQTTFAINGLPVHERYRLLGRDTTGRLWQYTGTGTTTAPLGPRALIGSGWNTYNQLTALSALPLSGLTGDLVARDSTGVLWYYRGGVVAGPFAPRTRVGAGWNAYNQLTGAGDLTGDGHPDLIARDTTGTLWLYQGTGKTTAPFTTRTRIGQGWITYNQLAGGSDLTGDGHPDLITRDATGNLWLYQGTGKAAAPFAPRAKVGHGWNIYNQLVVTGDLTADGKSDLVARDSAGALWLYRGTGNRTSPLAARSRIGGGWSIYNSLV